MVQGSNLDCLCRLNSTIVQKIFQVVKLHSNNFLPSLSMK